MANLFCVRADFGKHTQAFLKGNYVAIGWLPKDDLSEIKSREELYPLYRAAHPKDTSNVVIGQQVGQINRFLLEIGPEDYVITPAEDTEFIYYGIVEADPYFYHPDAEDCPYFHRKRIKWHKEPIPVSYTHLTLPTICSV